MSHARWMMNSPADQPSHDVGRDPTVAARVEQLYERHAALVRSVCGGLLRDRVEAEDAMQQTFLSAQRALLNGSVPRDEAAWLATIARNESLARVRGRMSEPLPVEVEEHVAAAADAHAAAMQRHEAGELREALAQLPLQQREAILLRELRGLSYQEVAVALSVTTSAVESLLFRARRSLQTRLRESLAALSPGWLQSLRELAAGFGSGGVVAPAAAKVAAVGVGTVLFAGGALAPTVIGLGHAPTFTSPAPPQAVHHIVDAAPSEAPVALWRAPAGVHPQRAAVLHTPTVSDVSRSSDRSERESSPATAAQHDDGADRRAPSHDTAGSTDGSATRDDGSSDDARSRTTSPGTTTTQTTTTTTTTDPVTTDD